MSNIDKHLENPLPSNEDAENTIIGSIILDNKLVEAMVQHLVPADFYGPVNRTLARAVVEVYQAGDPIDPITITENLKSRGIDPNAVGGASSILQLTLGLPYLSNIDEYITIVKDHSVARHTIQTINMAMNDILSGQVPISEVLEDSETKLLALSNRVHAERVEQQDKGFISLAEIVPAIEQQFKNYNAGISTGAATGLRELDDMLDGGGLQPKGVYLIAATEKTGKTSLALDWGDYGATKLNLTVPIVTLEMSKENLAKRLYSARTGIPYYMFRPGFNDSNADKVYTRALEGLKDFGQTSILIADRLFGLTEIARHLRRVCEVGLKAGKPVKYAIIDYLQLIEFDLKKTANREQEVSGVSRALKKLASELDIAVVVMSSLNRANMDAGQEPSPNSLRDSGQLAFDAEALIFLHNPAYIPGKPYEPQKVTDMVLILSRQRNGPTGRIPLKFIGPYMQFMTESQYRRLSKGGDIPLSMGQGLTEELEMDKLWDNANDKRGEDVDWG